MKKITLLSLSLLLLVFSVFSQTTEYWGTANRGGADGVGTIFKIDSSMTTLDVVHDFEVDNKGLFNNIMNQSEIQQNGKFYLTASGNSNFRDVLIEYDPNTNVYDILFDCGDFDSISGLSSNVYEYNNSIFGLGYFYTGKNPPIYDELFFFYEFNLSTKTLIKGNFLSTSLFYSDNFFIRFFKNSNKLYTLANNGFIIEYNMANNNYILKDSIQFDPHFTSIFNSIIQLNDSSFLAHNRSENYYCRYNFITDDFSSVSFLNNLNADFEAHFRISNNEVFGGSYSNARELYKYNFVNETLNKIFDFDTTNYERISKLVKLGSKIIGVTKNKNTNSFEIYEYNLNQNSITILDSFNTPINPSRLVIKAIDTARLLIIAKESDFNNYVFFEYNYNTNSINSQLRTNKTENGQMPVGSLLEHPNGIFYGLALGGKDNSGVIYSFNPHKNLYKVEVNFADYNISSPKTNLILHLDGNKMIGVCGRGGANLGGVLFSFNPNNNQIVFLKEFSTASPSCFPSSAPLLLPSGKLYGVCFTGSSTGGGLYSYDLISNTYSDLAFFSGSITGYMPITTPIISTLGVLYGTTLSGSFNNGIYEMGILYKYDFTTGQLTGEKGFNHATHGRNPLNQLIEYQPGRLFGTTFSYGLGSGGAIYEYNTYNDTLIIRHSFDSTGYYCKSSLFKASNGMLYGITSQGGQFLNGSLFEYNPITLTFAPKIYMNDYTGYIYAPIAFPGYSIYLDAGFKLIETNICYKTFSVLNINDCYSFTTPSGNATYYNSGIYYDTLLNANGCDSIITINFINTGPNTNITQQNEVLISQDSISSYQWLDCNNNWSPISGETQQSFTATQNGNYALELTTPDLCIDTTNCYAITDIGFSELSLEGVNIYPNPTKDKIIITLNSSVKTVLISDITAKQIDAIEVNNKEKIEIKLPENTGVYIIRLQNKEDVYKEFKVVKER